MNLRELRRHATDTIFETTGEEFTILAAGPFRTEKTILGIWQRRAAATDLPELDVQSTRLDRVLAVKVGDVPGIDRKSRLRGLDVDVDIVREFRVDSIDPRGDGTLRLELVPVLFLR